ncbi:MAG: hypothetical protein IPN17_24240 [Deltaproteobacteria bacterium]|jgi:hypothetical protein|nr:hypothetical protein [Deltaproteobacteria bacterium]MBK7068658.1 hypothetical protein [Deltaproteobacteria bacterium]MBK8695296.1 hypothetical protein [Deltaproteobacteria bacterium]MBP6831488.1 hypothetical protein [Deltaproteobacteria bacterium]
MANKVNLADPNFEPTDEDLQRLSREAFSELKARQIEMRARLRREVASLRVDALAYGAKLRAERPLR